MNRRAAWMLAVASVAPWGAALSGCASRSGTSAYLEQGEAARDPQRARDLCSQASRLGSEPEDQEKAERLVREALAADLYHGPAHNNLGVILLNQGRLYEAAGEFEWARKLMPGHPAPRVNLAMTLELAGRTDQAIEAYDAALAVYDGYLPALEGKTRLQVAARRTDKATPAALEEIALRGDEAWRAWALLWKAKLASGEVETPSDRP